MDSIIRDGNKYFPNGQMQTTNESGVINYQKLLDGWNELNAAQFTYYSSNQIEVSNGLASTDVNYIRVNTIFTLGDKIRIDQGSGWKYFYITEVKQSGDNLIKVAGGVLNVLTNDPILAAEYSRFPAPLDWPSGQFYYPITNVVASGGSGVVTSVNNTSFIWFDMVGGRVQGGISMGGTYTTGPITYLTVEIPADLRRASDAEMTFDGVGVSAGFGSPGQGVDSKTVIFYKNINWPQFGTIRSIPLDNFYPTPGLGQFGVNTAYAFQLIDL